MTSSRAAILKQLGVTNFDTLADPRPMPLPEWCFCSTVVFVALLSRWATTLKGEARSRASALLETFLATGLDDAFGRIWWCELALPSAPGALIARRGSAALPVGIEGDEANLHDLAKAIGKANWRLLHRRPWEYSNTCCHFVLAMF